LGQIHIKYGANLASKFTALSNGAILDEFGEQHQHQTNKKSINDLLALFKVQI
jgi:hypothetical protein